MCGIVRRDASFSLLYKIKDWLTNIRMLAQIPLVPGVRSVLYRGIKAARTTGGIFTLYIGLVVLVTFSKDKQVGPVHRFF